MADSLGGWQQLETQAREDVADRGALTLDRFSTIAAALIGTGAPAFTELRTASAEVELMLLSLCTDSLSFRISEGAAVGVLHAAFALHLVSWPELWEEEAATRPPTTTGFKERRLAALIAQELQAMATAARAESRMHAEIKDAQLLTCCGIRPPFVHVLDKKGGMRPFQVRVVVILRVHALVNGGAVVQLHGQLQRCAPGDAP